METWELAAAEALADPRVGAVSAEDVAAEAARHFPEARTAVERLPEADLDEARRARPFEWATMTLTHGEVLDAFAAYCRDELDDVTVLEQSATHLSLAWRREQSTIELRAGLLFVERLGLDTPTLLLAELTTAAIDSFLANERLRTRVAAYDLARLEKVNAVRASTFVYFEWFLRDAYGVKVVPAGAFTQGLVDRGIISLGMG